jgi:hypothetical protein
LAEPIGLKRRRQSQPEEISRRVEANGLTLEGSGPSRIGVHDDAARLAEDVGAKRKDNEPVPVSGSCMILGAYVGG